MKEKREEPGEENPEKRRQRPSKFKRILLWAAGIAAVILALVLVLFIWVNTNPFLGAEGADWLRGIFGDKAVAGLEMVIFQIQADFQRWKYDLGLINPVGDFGSFPSPTASPIHELRTNTPHAFLTTLKPTMTGTIISTPTASVPWQPVTIPPLSEANGEGVWVPYIQDA